MMLEPLCGSAITLFFCHEEHVTGAAPSALVQNEEDRMQSYNGLNVNKK